MFGTCAEFWKDIFLCRFAVLPWFGLVWEWWLSPAHGAGPRGAQWGTRLMWCCSRLINKLSRGCAALQSTVQAGIDRESIILIGFLLPSWCWFECFWNEWWMKQHDAFFFFPRFPIFSLCLSVCLSFSFQLQGLGCTKSHWTCKKLL